jgi:molybdopterin-guanine dinucleotide biosynthesis protein A
MSQRLAAARPVDLIVLAGGRGSRLGGASKPAVTVAGRTLLSRSLDAGRFARQVVVVGPASARPAAGAGAAGLLWALEDPPFGGPVAGIAAGLAALEAESPAAAWVLLLACDLPWAADAAGVLLAAASDLPGETDGVHLVDGDGRPQWLAGAYRASSLRAAVRRLGSGAHGASVRDLLAGLALRGIRDDAGAGNDVDTWADAARSTARLHEQAGDAGDPAPVELRTQHLKVAREGVVSATGRPASPGNSGSAARPASTLPPGA